MKTFIIVLSLFAALSISACSAPNGGGHDPRVFGRDGGG